MMHLEAIRLREVGTFREGCALEGMVPGLNVLVGPNELGKSTVFAALKLLFAEAYTANNKMVRRLQPNGGGAPFVECDFVADGRRWRLSKQFLAERVAELRERDGSTIYRGGDVEPALTELLAKALGARSNLDLLWVAQGQSFEQLKPDGAVRETLESLTRSEAEAVAGGSEIASVHSRVSEQLFRLVTERARRPKAGGAYLRALEHRNELDQRWHAANEKLEASQQRRDKLAEIESHVRNIEGAARAGGEARRIEALRKELEDGSKAIAQLELCQERVDRLEAEHGDATGQLERFDARVAEEAALAKQLKELAQRLAELTEERLESERDTELAEQQHAGALCARDDLNDEKLAAERQARRLGLETQLRDLKARAAQAREAEGELRELASGIDEISLDQATFGRLSKVRDEIATLEAQIAVTAGRVRIAYAPGASGRFERDGATIGEDTEIVVDHTVRITVPDVGEIVVQPGGDGSDLGARVDEKRAELTELLSQHGAASYEDATTQWESKRERVDLHESRTALLASLAPEGIDPLDGAVRELETQIAALGDGAAPAQDLAARITAAAEQLDTAAVKLAQSREKMSAIRETQVRLTAERDGLQARIDAIRRELPPDAQSWAAQRIELVGRLELVGERRNAVVRELVTWREAAPEPERFDALANDLKASEQKLRQDAARLAELREERQALDGALRRDLEDGVEVDARDLRQQLDAAQHAVERFELDIAALSVIDREIAAEREHLNRQTAGPVAERVNALAAQLLPQARLQIDQKLEVSRVERATGHEDIDQLSDGTREQISVLSRLALAGIFADGGHAVPLVLDDALVFSDDARLANMFALLATAANLHQVIVLTCHGRSFAPLVADHGAKELSLVSADVATPKE